MGYELKSKSFESYLLIEIIGEWPVRNADKIIEEILKLHTKNPLPILFDLRNDSSIPSIIGDYNDVAAFVNAKFHSLGKIAVLDKKERKEANENFELFATNRGLQFRFFYTKKDALKWLID